MPGIVKGLLAALGAFLVLVVVAASASGDDRATALPEPTTTLARPGCDDIGRVKAIVRRHVDDIDGAITYYNASPSNMSAGLMAFNTQKSGDAALDDLRAIGGYPSSAALRTLPTVTDVAVEMLLAAPDEGGSAAPIEEAVAATFDAVRESCA